MDQSGKDFKLVALIETEPLKGDLLKLLNPWISPAFEAREPKPKAGENITRDFSHQSQEERKSTEVFEEFDKACIQIQYQGKTIQISQVCLDLESENLVESILGDMLNADGLLLVFNETEEEAARLQDVMSVLRKLASENMSKEIFLLLRAKNEGRELDAKKIFGDVSIDERNIFRYSCHEDDNVNSEDNKKIISSLLDKIVEEKKKYFVKNLNANQRRIKKGLIEKPVMAVWKKEEFLKSFQKRRQFSRKLHYFNYSHMPTEENFEILKKSLVKSKFLREVDFDFSETTMFPIGDKKSNKVFRKFSQGFRKLNCLKVLKFKTGYQIGDKKLEYLAENLYHLSSLETLHLRYEFTGEDRWLPPGDLLSYTIKKRSPLKHIYLTFNIEEFEVASLVSKLKRISSLEGVHLDLKCSATARSTEESWQKLSQSLQKIPLLKTFKFRRFHQTAQPGVGDLSLKYISETLSGFDCLTEISLDFNGNIINDGSVICLGNALKKQNSLQKLTLLFANCELLTNEALIHLSTSLGSLNNLKNIFFNLNFCFELDDTFLNSLGNNLEILTNLENIKLWMIWCRKMNEETLENFEEKLKNKKNLKNLAIRS